MFPEKQMGNILGGDTFYGKTKNIRENNVNLGLGWGEGKVLPLKGTQ